MKNFRTILISLLISSAAFASNGTLRPLNNGFVLEPGQASPRPSGDDQNFGGSGSLCVSSATAQAYDPIEGIDHQPKGEFITLLKFDGEICADTTITQLALNLAITNGNQSAANMFNYLGGPGSFDLYWISSDWQQGYGTAKTPADATVGVTYNSLASLLNLNPPVYLETLYYDAYYSYYDGENWFHFELDTANPNFNSMLNALSSGQTITLMLGPSADSDVCFNIRAYVQLNSSGVVSYRDTGPILEIEALLSLSRIDFNQNGELDMGDFCYLAENWLAVGAELTADIAPLGGDGTVNLLDFVEFAKYW